MSERDKVVRFECGCAVKFKSLSNYKSTRMDACDQHEGKENREVRNRMVYQAKERLFGMARFDGLSLLNGKKE